MTVHEINVWARHLGIRVYWKRQHPHWRNWQRDEIAQCQNNGKRVGFTTEVEIETFLKQSAEGVVTV